MKITYVKNENFTNHPFQKSSIHSMSACRILLITCQTSHRTIHTIIIECFQPHHREQGHAVIESFIESFYNSIIGWTFHPMFPSPHIIRSEIPSVFHPFKTDIPSTETIRIISEFHPYSIHCKSDQLRSKTMLSNLIYS